MKLTYFPAILLIILSVLGFSYAVLKPKAETGQFAVVYPVGSGFGTNLASVVQSGARLVRVGTFSNILIVQSEDTAITSRLKNSGAVVLLNPLVEGSCFQRPQSI